MSEPARRRPAMNARTAAFVLAAVLLVYFVFAGARAYTMISSGLPVFVLLGLSILILPVLGMLLLYDQLRFGVATERLARRLDDEGTLPDVTHLPRKPSGRVERDAADAWFDEKQAELDADPENWRNWYAVAEAYDLAGDRNRGRKAMRKAIDLERNA